MPTSTEQVRGWARTGNAPDSQPRALARQWVAAASVSSLDVFIHHFF